MIRLRLFVTFLFLIFGFLFCVFIYYLFIYYKRHTHSAQHIKKKCWNNVIIREENSV